MVAERERLTEEVFSKRVKVVDIKPIVRKKDDGYNTVPCDFCGRGMASHNLIFDGLFNGIRILKRCCPECAKAFI